MQTTYQQLLLDYGLHNLIPYSELLSCVEWIQKREVIINRDNEKCQVCHEIKTYSVFIPGKQTIHFYEDYKEIEVFDKDGLPRVSMRKVIKGASRAINLHVHHTYYAFDRKPWDYPNESLITLCGDCHFELHKNNKIPWLSVNNKFKHLTPCPRCNGAGRFPEYSHVQDGTCFYCKGDMYIELMKR